MVLHKSFIDILLTRSCVRSNNFFNFCWSCHESIWHFEMPPAIITWFLMINFQVLLWFLPIFIDWRKTWMQNSTSMSLLRIKINFSFISCSHITRNLVIVCSRLRVTLFSGKNCIKIWLAGHLESATATQLYQMNTTIDSN